MPDTLVNVLSVIHPDQSFDMNVTRSLGDILAKGCGACITDSGWNRI